MEAHADPHGIEGTRMGRLRLVLRELQHDARRVFASSGETVDRFLRDRQNEARQEFDVPT
jgi:hypothetical protein